MRIERRTADGITYQASFRKKPTQQTLEALDAIARAAIEHVTEVQAWTERPEPIGAKPSAESSTE